MQEIKEIKTITEQEIIDFIKSQPDDRKLNLVDNYSGDPCGCVMVQYGKDVLKIQENFACCYRYITLVVGQEEQHVASLDKHIVDIIGKANWNSLPDTYGELKGLMGLV